VLLDAGAQIVGIWRLRATRGEQRLDQPTVSLLTIADGVVVDLEMFHHDTNELRAFLDGSAAGARPAPA